MAPSENVIMGFTAEQAAKLSGLSTRQLAAWERSGFFKPRIAVEGNKIPYGKIYSFRNIVGLRVLGELRNRHKISLQQLKRVAAELGHRDFDLWADTTLYVVKGKVVFDEAETGRKRAVDGQYVANIPLERVIGDVRGEAEQLRQRRQADIGKVLRDRHVAHNAWTVAGTRIPTAAIKRYKDAGYSDEQIIAEYPSLQLSDIKAALDHEKDVAA